jgi:hypothetical protein
VGADQPAARAQRRAAPARGAPAATGAVDDLRGRDPAARAGRARPA